ncbi:hypothetical protein FV242_33075 [Methylobacterium sp. WL64]|nr:hypothetical protein FV242_33075 [Methylobacterium sp. WL64]
MFPALPADLRERVVVAIESGAARGKAASWFVVSPAGAVCARRFVREVRTRAKPMGGDQLLYTNEARADLIRQPNEAKLELFLHELCARMAEQGLWGGVNSLSRFFNRHSIPPYHNAQTKSGHATEQDRENVKGSGVSNRDFGWLDEFRC